MKAIQVSGHKMSLNITEKIRFRLNSSATAYTLMHKIVCMYGKTKKERKDILSKVFFN